MLDFENQTLDPAIVSAQPMNPAQNMDIPQLVCPPGWYYVSNTELVFLGYVKFVKINLFIFKDYFQILYLLIW